jgi:hypothetical protein
MITFEILNALPHSPVSPLILNSIIAKTPCKPPRGRRGREQRDERTGKTNMK